MIDVPALSTPADHAALALGVRYIGAANVQGDVAEFGTFFGATAQVLALAMVQEQNSSRKLWLFDSFAGLPEITSPVDAASPQVANNDWQWRYEHHSKQTPEKLVALCGQYLATDRLVIGDGWYKDTLKEIPPETKFGFVHIDCDLYESTMEVLTHLFANKMLADGCALFFDDWYCNRGRPEYGEQKAWADVPKWGYRYADWGAYGLVGRKFILYRD